MLQVELIQVFQMLILLFVTFLLAYSFVLNFRFIKSFFAEVRVHCCVSTIILYFRTLYTVNYNCYHKYEIWRKYRFS
ncbi:MAG: hypothetical protein K0R50_1809 [Eubacterium sp.]|jgi:hypothetical protein|nr:hypothetical protein [Eubacterium sp.]